MSVVKTFEDLDRAIQNKEKIIHLDVDVLKVSKTIWLYSNIEIIGKKNKTVIILEKGSNCHIISNKEACENIRLENLYFQGNGYDQKREGGNKELAFSCAVYLKSCNNIRINNIYAENIRQTGIHLSSCNNAKMNDIFVKTVGWSVLSTYNSSSVEVNRISGTNAGLDIQHSGIHIDGGRDIFINDSYIAYCTGNGIMFDNTAGDLNNFGISRSFVSNCKRGVSLSANHKKEMSGGRLNFVSTNNEVGAMIANSQNIQIVESIIFNNKKGLELQGRRGVDNVVLKNNKIINNGENSYISDNTRNITYENNFEYMHSEGYVQPMATSANMSVCVIDRETLLDKYKELPIVYKDDRNNIIVGTYDNKMLNIEFKGVNNLCILNNPRITNGNVDFQSDDGIMVLNENSDLKGKTRLGLNCKLIIGKNLALGGSIDFRLAEKTTVEIGDDCMFAQKVLFSTDDTHPIFDVISKERVNKSDDIRVSNHVWIAEGAKILKGNIIEQGSVIGMYSLLSHKRIPNNCIAVGNPVRIVKKNIAWEKNFLNNKPYLYNSANDGYKNFQYYDLTKE